MCVCVFNDDSVYMCDMCMSVCLRVCVGVCSPRMGEGKEEKKRGRESGGWCVCVSM